MSNEQVLKEVMKAFDSVVVTTKSELKNIVSHKPNKIESIRIEFEINNRDLPKVYITERCYGEPVMSVLLCDNKEMIEEINKIAEWNNGKKGAEENE